jgi:hypothetical protein
LVGHHDIVSGCKFFPDGKQLLSWSHDRTLRLWDVARGCELLAWTAHTDRVTAADVSPDGQWLASAGRDGNIILWEAASQREVGRYSGFEGEIHGCFFAPNAELLASISSQGDVILHAVPDFKNRTGQATELGVPCAALAPTGDCLALGTATGEVTLLPLEGMAEQPLCVTPLESHEPRQGILASLRGQSFQRVLRCVCPVCRQSVPLPDPPTRTVRCPGCRRQLRPNRFTVPV